MGINSDGIEASCLNMELIENNFTRSQAIESKIYMPSSSASSHLLLQLELSAHIPPSLLLPVLAAFCIQTLCLEKAPTYGCFSELRKIDL